MEHLKLARAMSLSMPPEAPSRQEIIEEWTRKGFTKRRETDSHYLKVVDTELSAEDGAGNEVEIVLAATSLFNDSKEGSRKTGSAQVPNEAKEQRKENEDPADTGVRAEIRRKRDLFKRDYFPNQKFASRVVPSCASHTRRSSPNYSRKTIMSL
jgi:hypothetical protein